MMTPAVHARHDSQLSNRTSGFANQANKASDFLDRKGSSFVSNPKHNESQGVDQLSAKHDQASLKMEQGSVKLETLKPLLEHFMQGADIDRPLRVDLVAHNGVHLYQFLGYILDCAGELTKIYDDMCKDVIAENERRQKEYLEKLKEIQATNSYTSKLELPQEEPLPEKKFESMFEEYIKINEMGLTDEFHVTLFEKKFIFQYKILDKVTPERIRTLPDAVIFLIEGQEEEFMNQFVDCDEIKQAFFMHLFFGTRNIFFFLYFNYRDRLMRHWEYQQPMMRKAKAVLDQVFAFVADKFYGDCSRVQIKTICVKLRTDSPQNVSKVLHINKARQLLDSKDSYARSKDKDFEMLSLDFLKSVHHELEYKEVAKSKPLRFLIFETYIIGGVGTYVTGEVLSGILRPETELLLTPGDLNSEIAFVDKDRELIEQANPGDRVGISIPNLKPRQIPRGSVLSEKANHPARGLKFALGFFLMVNFKGLLPSGTQLNLIMNRISRRCKITIDSIIRMDKEVVIDKVQADSIKSKTICFMRLEAIDELVLDDPNEFPEFSMAQLWDNCQTVAIGKIFKLVYDEKDLLSNRLSIPSKA